MSSSSLSLGSSTDSVEVEFVENVPEQLEESSTP